MTVVVVYKSCWGVVRNKANAISDLRVMYGCVHIVELFADLIKSHIIKLALAVVVPAVFDSCIYVFHIINLFSKIYH